jgi:hypothetical protein
MNIHLQIKESKKRALYSKLYNHHPSSYQPQLTDHQQNLGNNIGIGGFPGSAILHGTSQISNPALPWRPRWPFHAVTKTSSLSNTAKNVHFAQ